MQWLDSVLSPVLTHCQVYSVAASLAVLYTATSQSGAECIHSLLPLLQHPFIADGLQLKVGGLNTIISVLRDPLFHFPIPLLITSSHVLFSIIHK